MKSLLGGVWGYVAACVLGAVLAGAGIYFYQQAEIERQTARADAGEALAREVNGKLTTCTTAAEAQNQAVQAAADRARRAEQAMDGAEVGRLAAEKRAQEILRQRTPPTQTACAAAKTLIGDELRRERAK